MVQERWWYGYVDVVDVLEDTNSNGDVSELGRVSIDDRDDPIDKWGEPDGPLRDIDIAESVDQVVDLDSSWIRSPLGIDVDPVFNRPPRNGISVKEDLTEWKLGRALKLWWLDLSVLNRDCVMVGGGTGDCFDFWKALRIDLGPVNLSFSRPRDDECKWTGRVTGTAGEGGRGM